MADPVFTWTLGIILVLYVLVMFGISIWAQGQIKNREDFLVAGRRLPLSLAWATLLATWFGAGTVLTQSNEVMSDGLKMAALDPLGAGCCLILAGLFFARPLWKMNLLTLPDFFRRQFGLSTEILSAAIMVPGYFGWVAAQLVAMSLVLNVFFGMPPTIGILLVAVIGMGYTLMGGMWSVTLTDAIQIVLVLVGLVALGFAALSHLGDGSTLAGMRFLLEESDPKLLEVVPTASLALLGAWVGAFTAGALGNIPGQDLMQRVFAAKSASTAQWACILAGVLYLTFGAIPVMLGLAGNLIPFEGDSVVPGLAVALFRSRLVLVIFVVALISAVISTIDSAILSPSSVLSENILQKIPQNALSPLILDRIAVFLVTAASVAMAFLGESAYELLEGAYTMPMVGLFVPLTLGLYLKPRGQLPALLSMIVGIAIWLPDFIGETWELPSAGYLGPFPVSIAAVLGSLCVYLAAYWMSEPTT